MITETYSIFRYQHKWPAIEDKKAIEHLRPNPDPDFLGSLRFEVPEKLFTYEPGRFQSLNSDEVQELIEQLTDLRDNPGCWPNKGLC